MTAWTLGAQLGRVRHFSVLSGIALLILLAFLPEGALADRIAVSALIAIGIAAAAGWIQVVATGRRDLPVPEKPEVWKWWLSAGAVALVAGLAMQTWFRLGTSIAEGDLTPPQGTAWISNLLEPWVWTGSNLGEPSQLVLQLPWAAVLEGVNTMGGDPELAQRIWFTTLFIAAGLGALGLIAALRLSPVAGFVGATAYVFSPYMVSWINVNHVFMAAFGLLPATLAVLIAVGTKRLSIRLGASLIGLAAPMFGYVYMNPPLLGMVLGGMFAAPLVAYWLDGQKAGFRSLRALALAIPLLLGASLYWIVPEVISYAGIASDQLASLASWTWAEGRATVRNGLWLNTIWSWTFVEYFPYARSYELFPLALFRFALPALAFSALAIDRFSAGERALRIVIVAATAATGIIFISTGTNPPGSIAFDVLYGLPHGWLLREPGRFLMAAGLAYSVLIAVVVDASSRLRVAVALNGIHRRVIEALRSGVAPLALGIVFSLGYPLFTGVLVPDNRALLPSAHVRVPDYWGEMAQFVDSLHAEGAMLVLPPDDFYQMPYTWGYYGNDGFIVNMFHRRVLVPNPQGYVLTAPGLLSAVNVTADNILNRNWNEVGALTAALGAPFILVRRDISSPYVGRAILPPNDLATALSTAPNFTHIRTEGLLELFAKTGTVRELELVSDFATVNTEIPDLRLLSAFPPYSTFVSGEPRPGVPSVIQAPPIGLWQATGDRLIWIPKAPPGVMYRIADLDSRAAISLDHSGNYLLGQSRARIAYTPSATNTIIVSVSRTTAAMLSFALLAVPEQPERPLLQLAVLHESFSTNWAGSIRGEHVLVDGMLNGWLIPPVQQPFLAAYIPADQITAGELISIVAFVLVVLLAIPLQAWFRAIAFVVRRLNRT